WARTVGSHASSRDEDFFDVGGSSLAAAELVSVLREQYPAVTVADVYEHPTIGELADRLGKLRTAGGESRIVARTPLSTEVWQVLAMVPLFAVRALRWLTWIAIANNIGQAVGLLPWAPTISWWVVAPTALIVISPPGRLAATAATARVLLR